MKIKVDKEFYKICKEILDEKKTINEWEQIESSDMFQTENYCGGYDATEGAFCFSYFDKNGDEFWFQIPLEAIKEVVAMKKEYLSMRKADI